MRISDWSSDVCSSDLCEAAALAQSGACGHAASGHGGSLVRSAGAALDTQKRGDESSDSNFHSSRSVCALRAEAEWWLDDSLFRVSSRRSRAPAATVRYSESRYSGTRCSCFWRSEEHTSELQSLM